MPVNTQSKNIILQPTKAPNLPIGPVEYSQQYQDQITNALRLYFSQIDNVTQALILPDSGTTLNRPINTGLIKLRTGQTYFDTTLGIPIWWNGTNWVNASGASV
jgi:hypothetical protein